MSGAPGSQVPGYREVVAARFTEMMRADFYPTREALEVLQDAYPDPQDIPVNLICIGSLSFKQYHAIMGGKTYEDIGIDSMGAVINWHLATRTSRASKLAGGRARERHPG